MNLKNTYPLRTVQGLAVQADLQGDIWKENEEK